MEPQPGTAVSSSEDGWCCFWQCGEMCCVGSRPQAVESEGSFHSSVAWHTCFLEWERTEAECSDVTSTFSSSCFFKCECLGGGFFFCWFWSFIVFGLEKMSISGLHAHVGSLTGSWSKPSGSHGRTWVNKLLVLNLNHLLSCSLIITRTHLSFNFKKWNLHLEWKVQLTFSVRVKF